MRAVVFGQFLPGQSALHRLDPRTKLGGLVAYALLLCLGPVWTAAAVCAVLTAASLASVRPPLRSLARGLAPITMLAAVTVLADCLFASGHGAAGGAWVVVRERGLLHGLAPAVRVWLLACQSTLVTLTTEAHDLVAAAGRLARPLSRLGVPVADGVLMGTVALRFVPLLLEEAQRIALAQRARGAGAGGGLRSRWTAALGLLTPLLTGVLRRSDDLALALAARGWSGVGRTSWRVPRPGALDAWVLVAMGGAAAWVVLASFSKV